MKIGSATPWGKAQSADELAPGITAVCTAGHGGIHLDRKHANRVPQNLIDNSWLGKSSWFEEDCDWCIPFVLFESEILAGTDDQAKKVIAAGIHTQSFERNHK